MNRVVSKCSMGAESMIIREYREEDLEAVTELMHELGYPTTLENMKARMNRIATAPMHFTFVAELDVKVAGMAGVRQCYPHEVDALVIQIETHSYLVSDAIWKMFRMRRKRSP